MRLVRQVTLHFIGGNSRKAYEVDLCDVGDGNFVVNFRYGRIGSNLRDGTKTAAPVDEAKAQHIFDALVDEKKAKGYVEVDAAGDSAAPTPSAAPAAAPPTVRPSSDAQAGRKNAVLAQLAAAGGGGRRVGRLARSAAELGLVEAVPLLLRHLEAQAPAQKAARPKLRLVGGAPKKSPPPGPMGTVVAFSTIDMVGRLRTEDGEELKFGASACKGFYPREGEDLLYSDVDEHPLGGRRAQTLRLLPGEEKRRAAERAVRVVPERRKVDDPAARRRQLERWGIVWALARLATPAVFDTLAALYFDDGDGELSPLARMAAQGALRAATEAQRAHLTAHLLDRLPASVARALDEAGPSSPSAAHQRALNNALSAHLAAMPYGAGYRVIDLLYLAGGEAGRAAVLQWLDDAKLEPPAFQRVRHLFKAAELGGDWELFGRIAHKMETTRAMYTSPTYGYGVYLKDWTFVKLDEELKREDPRLAFSSSTRWYFRRRVWRVLRRLGVRGLDDYVKAAVGVLSPFSETDGRSPQTSTRYDYTPPADWRTPRRIITAYDRFAGYKAFNHVLYAHSPRYQLVKGRVTWSCTEGYSPGDPAPEEREEAFPERWDAQPVGLLHLLTSSACTPVLEFAARAARVNRAYFDAIDDEPIGVLLMRPYRIAAELGWELAQTRLQRGVPSASLVVGLLLAFIEQARAAGRSALSSLSSADRPVVIGRAVGRLRSLSADAPSAPGVALVDALAAELSDELSALGPDVLRDLLTALSMPAQLLAVAAMAARTTAVAALPGDLILMPLSSEHPEVRRRGVGVLVHLGADVLAERLALLRDLVQSPHAEVREAAGPLVVDVASKRPDLGADLATLLCATLLRKEPSAGVHADVLKLLRGPLQHALAHLAPATVWRLVGSRQTAAQELGGVLLSTHVNAADVELRQMARLLSHDVLSVREAGRALAEQSVPRLKAALPEAVRFLDAKWEDSRQWAMRLFRAELLPDGVDVAPVGVLVGICDSPRPAVQQFGRDLVQRHFQDTMGHELLAKLSEHPSGSLQLYVTSLLERFCDGPERLEQLAPYFVTVLARVNKGGVTKARVYRFLDEQAQTSERAARCVAGILNRQSATMAVGDKARTLETLCTISERWPSVDVALHPVVTAKTSPAPAAGGR